MAILEWSDPTHSLITVSLHTYERTLRVVRPAFSFARAAPLPRSS